MFLINRNKHQNDHHHHHDRLVPSTERFEWVQYNGSLPKNAVYASTKYVVIRGFYQNEWIPGKLNLSQKAAYVPYGNKEVHITSGIEILTMKPGYEVAWVPASHGQVVHDAVGPIGKEGTYVGRVVCPHPENIATPGKIHPGYKAFYLPWDGKEHKCDNYEVCVIRPQSHQPSPFVPTPSVGAAYNWVPYQGSVPQGAVTAGSNYVVIQAYHGNEWVPGKLNLAQRAAYIPYGGKEIHVTSNIQVLTHAPGAEVHWIQSSHGQVPQNAVGPIGKDKTFIGRAICPKPENTPTPGKIHPSHKCMYMPWDGKEHKSDAYEVCVIQFPQHNTYPSMPSFPIPNQPGFGQHGFGQPGFQQPSFQQPGFIQPGFMQPGFGHPGFAPGGHFGPGGNFGSNH